VFENRVLRRMFGPKRDDVTGSLRKNAIRIIMSRNRAYSTHGENRNVCKIMVEKPEGKRPIGRSRSRWESNIKMYLK
jgi:hypothetical protein